MKKTSLLLVLLALAVSINVVSAIEACTLTTLVSQEISPDKTLYSEKETVTAVVKIKNSIGYEKSAYTLNFYTGLDIVGTWSCSRSDDQPCTPIAGDTPQMSRVNVTPISSVIGNTTIFGDMPETITISVTGKTPVSITKKKSIPLIRVRQERDNCEIVSVFRDVSSGNVSDVDSCLSDASSKIDELDIKILKAKNAGLDVTSAQKWLTSAQGSYNNANRTYYTEGVTAKNKAFILENCNAASQTASDAIKELEGGYGPKGLMDFLMGVVLPAVLIIVVILLLFMFLKRGRWDRL